MHPGGSQNLHHASVRRQATAEGPPHRQVTGTPRGYGGILNGMKVGRAGTSGDIDPRMQHDSKFPNVGPIII
jgi:hypothetical protein